MCPVGVPKDATTIEPKLVRCSQNVIKRLSAAFVEGLAWCLAYYVKGCVDWRWFFPCPYCPMLSDVVNVATALAGAHFEVSAPLRPLEQLMSCLPPASARLLPRPHRALMLEDSSPLHDFYPSDFDVDMEGKRNPKPMLDCRTKWDTDILSRILSAGFLYWIENTQRHELSNCHRKWRLADGELWALIYASLFQPC